MSNIIIYEGVSGSGKTFEIESICIRTWVEALKPFNRGQSKDIFYSIRNLKQKEKGAAILNQLNTDLTVSLEYVRIASQKESITTVFDRLFLSPVCLYESYVKYFKLDVEYSLLIESTGDLFFSLLEQYNIKWNIMINPIKERKLDYDQTGRITKRFHDNFITYSNKWGLK